MFIVTQTTIHTSARSTKRCPFRFDACGTLLYHYQKIVRGFGWILIPDHYRRPTPRPVSYYALFKWWLLLSQHPGCHCNRTSLRTKHPFGTLAGGLGCFPFVHEDYPPQTDSRDRAVWYSEFGRGGYPGWAPAPVSSSTPTWCHTRLALKLFRGERDISEFDETLTPPHSSSHVFSTTTGSAFQKVLPFLQPGHG